MPRPRMLRKVGYAPKSNYFKPAGMPMSLLKEVILTIDEFESIRLKDYEDKDQETAAKIMGISQPTFNRLLKTARKKLAEAIVEPKAIKIEGGNYGFVKGRRFNQR